MTMPAPIASASCGRVVAAACLVLAVGIASAQTKPAKRPTPADLAKQHSQDVESPQSKADKAAPDKATAKKPAPTEVIKQREQELDTLRAEQQQATEAAQKLAAENELISED